MSTMHASRTSGAHRRPGGWPAVDSMIRLAFQVDGWRASAASTLTIFAAVQPVAVAVLVGMATNAAVAHRTTRAVDLGIALGLILASWIILLWLTFGIRAVVEEKVRHAVEMDLARGSVSAWSLRLHEDSRFADELALVERDVTYLGQIIIFAMTLIGVLVQLGLALVVLGSTSVWLLYLPVVGLLPITAGRLGDRWRQEALGRVATTSRVADGLFEIQCSSQRAQELAVMQAEDGLRQRYHKLAESAQAVLELGLRRSNRLQMLASALFGLGYVGAIVIALFTAVAGHASIGRVMVTVTLAAQIAAQVSVAADVSTQLLRARSTAARYFGLVRRLAEASPSPAHDQDPITDGGHSLRLKDVVFRYPGTNALALNGVDVNLAAGRTIAVVGRNGAGKTTIGKLLCRLYDPDSGGIEWDDTDLRSLGIDQWRGATSAAYQDFVRFELSLLESVGIGDLPRIHDKEQVVRALGRAGGASLADRLPDGLDTELGESFPSGRKLSEGQWQQVAVARALMRQRPRVLLFDEPTASFDAETERRLFQEYADAAAAVQASGNGIVVIITHRLGSVMFADQIVVLEQGTIVESGTHSELLSVGGLYSDLYLSQAEMYAVKE
jgi:ATP-binding cassette, subfamily B, bacterial